MYRGMGRRGSRRGCGCRHGVVAHVTGYMTHLEHRQLQRMVAVGSADLINRIAQEAYEESKINDTMEKMCEIPPELYESDESSKLLKSVNYQKMQVLIKSWNNCLHLEESAFENRKAALKQLYARAGGNPKDLDIVQVGAFSVSKEAYAKATFGARSHWDFARKLMKLIINKTVGWWSRAYYTEGAGEYVVDKGVKNSVRDHVVGARFVCYLLEIAKLDEASEERNWKREFKKRISVTLLGLPTEARGMLAAHPERENELYI